MTTQKVKHTSLGNWRVQDRQVEEDLLRFRENGSNLSTLEEARARVEGLWREGKIPNKPQWL